MPERTHPAVNCLLLLAAAAAALLAGCTRDTTDEPVEAPPPTMEMAQLVSHVTSGAIASTGAVRVRFVDPAVPAEMVGHSLKAAVFSFQPPIVGVTSWENRRTLVFEPNQRLPVRQRYQGRLDLDALLGDDGRSRPSELQFDLVVAGREIEAVEGNFVLEKPGDPRWLRYRGEISFTEPAEPKTVEGAARLYLDQGPLALSWSAGAEGRSFTYISPAFERIDRDRHFVLRVASGGLGLSQGYEQEFSLAPLKKMQLQRVEKRDHKQPHVILHFSDEVDSRQDIRGLLTAEPAAALRARALGTTVAVHGDFEPGRSYVLTLHPGIRSRWGAAVQEGGAYQIDFEDLKPQIRFARSGVFLPTARQRRIRFSTLNLTQVRLEVKKVFESNLGQFLQTERLDSTRDRRGRFRDHNVNRVGVRVAYDTLEIGGQRNLWLDHELDLSQLIEPDEKGLFLLELRFDREDMLYGSTEEAEAARQRQRASYDREAYRSSPYLPGYVHTHGRVYKPVVVSDIGLTYKRAHERHLVYATHIEDARPLEDVEIRLRTYQNQLIAEARTDEEGRADFRPIEEGVFYVEAEYQGQRSLIKPNEMGWNLSTFDTGGAAATPDGTQAFIYTERGVYRPGDPVHLAVIARHHDHSFPDDLPVELEVYNPRNQLVVEQVQRQARDGFYRFRFATRPQDPTGSWRAEILVGGSRFTHVVKVETVVPFKLKTELRPERKRLGPMDRTLRLDVESRYLFGAPAAGLKAELSLRLANDLRSFSRWSGFFFGNELIDYKEVQATLFDGLLDSLGRARIEWPLPALDESPSGLKAVLTAKVLERGGRPNTARLVLPVDPYECYVGIKKPTSDYGYFPVGTETLFSVVAADSAGGPAAGRPLTYRIYKGTPHWWWEYDRRDTYRKRFKSDQHTEVVEEGRLTAGEEPVDLPFTPADRGEYVLEVSDVGGHTAALFFRAYAWGSSPRGEGAEATLVLKADKQVYAPGEEARIRFPVPDQGAVLFSVERGAEILEASWHRPDGEQTEMVLSVPITAAMAPTAYAVVSLIQPYSQTSNDRPIRMYGVVPLHIVDPGTVQELRLTLPEELRPQAAFQVEVQTTDHQPTQFTIAVVDEGLLALTDFDTPDPWQGFFQRLRLGVSSFDLFAHVIGAVQGDVFRIFSIGGEMSMAEKMLGALPGQKVDPRHRKRFEAVSMFEGPLMTDAQGRATVDFDMPHYVGAVRIMVVAAQGRRYGHAERTVPVKTDLLVLPSLPRFLVAGDRFALPVTVFALSDRPGTVAVSLALEGPLALLGPGRQTLEFPTAGTRDVAFEVQVEPAVGIAVVRVEARAGSERASQETTIQVRTASPRVYISKEVVVEPGDRVSLVVPDDGIGGTNEASIAVRRQPHLDLESRLEGLVRYPHGCIEQTVSAAFPQLYFKDLVELPPDAASELEFKVDAHINAAIERLRRFQLADGSFGFWPGGSRPSVWGSLYAGHFVLEARDLGYHVPPGMLERWLQYQRSQALMTRDPLVVRVKRAYLLALAGEPSIGAMNLLKESSLEEMNDTQKWLLAATYQLAGVPAIAAQLADRAGTEVEDYVEFAGTYGSGLRDKALILHALLLCGRRDLADTLAGELAATLSTSGWLSTQATGAALVALGKYLKSLEGTGATLVGRIALPDGATLEFDTQAIGYRAEITSGFGQPAEVYLDSSSNLQRAFVSLEWDGIPLQSDVQDQAENLKLTVEWLSEDGRPVNPAKLVQGTSFWGHFRVSSPTYANRIEELALAQLLPSGWEIENTRLSGAARPKWMRKWRLNQEEYVDILDEGIVWFFDLRGRREHADFAVKLNAVTRGQFTLPPAVVEAMYNRDFRALKTGGSAVVTP